jgi:hypothetical protein
MKWLKTLLDFYIRSSLHVAICFVALFIVSNFWNSLSMDLSILVLLFCGVVIGYNLIKYGSLVVHGITFKYRFWILSISSIAGVIAFYLVWNDSIGAQIVVVAAGLLGILYAFPLLRHRNMRQLPVIKLIMVALSWTIMIYLLPYFSNYIEYGYSYSCDALPITSDWRLLMGIDMIQLFLLVIALCIPFEIRDLKYDAPQLRTIPQMIGTLNSKMLGLALCVVYIVIELLQYGWLDDIASLSTYIVISITALSIWFADKIKTDYYASFFVEGIPLLWLLLMVLLE